jgi:beta-lactamase regulating signal transducer with metallopeptidase domain
MFVVRGLAVSFSIFVMFYIALSVAVCCLWRTVWRYSRQVSARRCADWLFVLRMIPLAGAAVVTLAFAVPSFLLLEPRVTNEPVGVLSLTLSLCGVAALLAGIWKAVAASLRVSRTIARWSREASAIDSSAAGFDHSVPLMRISAPAPPLTAAGLMRPSVWLSGAAEFVLNERELRSALRHELVHVRHRDNLRKLALCLVTFPGMAELESAWRESTEMAADDAAVSSSSEALDLAAAVIKLSRLASLQVPLELTTALVHTPAESVNARVERLLAWSSPGQSQASELSPRFVLFAAATMLATLAVTYSQLLVRVHAATEWLVR